MNTDKFISNNKKISFKFTNKQQTLIIQAIDTQNTIEYIYEMPSHPNINFIDIQQYLLQSDYKLITKNSQHLLIKIGMIRIQLISKSRIQVRQINKSIKRLQQKQNQLQQIINQQNLRIDQHQNTIAELKAALHTLKIEIDNQRELKLNEINEIGLMNKKSQVEYLGQQICQINYLNSKQQKKQRQQQQYQVQEEQIEQKQGHHQQQLNIDNNDNSKLSQKL